MKKLTILFLLSYSISFTQDVQITNWYNNKKFAVVMTYDDWLEGQEKIIVPELIKRKLPATMFVTVQAAKWRTTAFPLMRLAQANGIEIANHTITHPSLTDISLEKAKIEIDSARKVIMDSVPGARCLTFAYPMGTKNPEVIRLIEREHIAARAVNAADEKSIIYDFDLDSADYFKIPTARIWHIITLGKVSKWLDYAEKGGGLLTFMMHSVYDDSLSTAKGWDAMPKDYMLSMMDSLKSREDSIWVTTLESAVKYHKQKKASAIRIVKDKKGTMEIVIECDLDPKIYDHELTINLNKKSANMVIKQNDKVLSSTESKDGLWIYFNALPGKVEVTYSN
ncbi:MAG: polysaccharide deacetylase family protein [Flavobacteriales bacterium]